MIGETKEKLNERTGKQNFLQSRAKRQNHKNKETRKLESQSKRPNICKIEVSESKILKSKGINQQLKKQN